MASDAVRQLVRKLPGTMTVQQWMKLEAYLEIFAREIKLDALEELVVAGILGDTYTTPAGRGLLQQFSIKNGGEGFEDDELGEEDG